MNKDSENISRRQFLKIAGLSTLFGVGAISSYQLLKPGDLEAFHEPEIVRKQFAMVVDTSKFKTDSDFQRLIDACHTIHNVPDFGNYNDKERIEIKWIWKERYEHIFEGQSHQFVSEEFKKKEFIAMCNHCSNSPCARVCPTNATFKRETDGIVMMDPHRCIGCRFCMAGCPYGSRSFNYIDPKPYVVNKNTNYPVRTRGVVEKCTFCQELVGRGKLPACVEACQDTQALIFGDINDPNSSVRTILKKRFSIVRKAEVSTKPNVFYII